MGNWVTLEALRQMAIRDGRVAPKVKVVLLADADVDVGIAREQITALGPDHPHIVLFVSENDRALAAAREIWGAPRLGAIDPDVEPYKSMIEQEQLSVINMTRMPSHDFFNHGKFAEDPKVVELIGRRLAEGQVLTDRRVGLGGSRSSPRFCRPLGTMRSRAMAGARTSPAKPAWDHFPPHLSTSNSTSFSSISREV